METNNQLTEVLRGMGVHSVFKPYRDSESGTILLQVRKPAVIEEGQLKGLQIEIYDPSTFRVWTPQTKKAKAYAVRYALRIRLLDGECELFIPVYLADKLLREFGAKVKRTISGKRLDILRAFAFKKHAQEGT